MTGHHAFVRCCTAIGPNCIQYTVQKISDGVPWQQRSHWLRSWSISGELGTTAPPLCSFESRWSLVVGSCCVHNQFFFFLVVTSSIRYRYIGKLTYRKMSFGHHWSWSWFVFSLLLLLLLERCHAVVCLVLFSTSRGTQWYPGIKNNVSEYYICNGCAFKYSTVPALFAKAKFPKFVKTKTTVFKVHFFI